MDTLDEKRFLKRKAKAQQDGNREQLAVCCNVLADYYNEQGRHKDAVVEYLQEAELYAALGKRLAMAKAHRMVGEMHMLLSEFDKAKEHINLYLRTATKLKNKVEEQRAYATLGRAHLLHGQSCGDTSASQTLMELKQAERAFLKSLLLIKELTGQISKLEQLDMQARCYLNIGVVKETMEACDESIAYIEKAIEICKAHDLFELTHLCYISMSIICHSKKGDPTQALRYCNMALEVAKRLPNKVKKICETLMTKTDILLKEGDFASAKQMLTKAYKKRTPDDIDRATIEKQLRIVVKICQILDELVTTSSVDFSQRKTLYEKLGDGSCQLQNYAKAIEFYQHMLKCAEQAGETGTELVPIYVSLYQTYKDSKQYDKALEYLWKEYELNKKVPAEACSTLCGVAEIYELQLQPFWTVQDIYQSAKEQAALAGSTAAKWQRVVYVRLKRLQVKHKMDLLAEELTLEAQSKGIAMDDPLEDDEGSEAETDASDLEQNTPQLGEDVCLDDLTDTDASDVDESDKVRPQRITRGPRCIAVKRNNKGETQLHQACIAGNVELVRHLLDQGHVANVRDHAGWIPLHEACNHGHRDIVALLLDRGAAAAINDKGGTSCDGITPLYDACANGYLDVVELLLERGADATLRTDFGDTCVDGLDKWRRSANLTDGEQAQYIQVRAILQRPLTQLGIGRKKGGPSRAPLTNASVTIATETYDEQASADDGVVTPTTARNGRQLNLSGSGGRTLKERNKTTSRQASAEYKHVMEQLKRPNRVGGIDCERLTTGNGDGVKPQPKRSALLGTAEVDDVNWLVDDVGPEKKKRRFCMPTIESISARTTIKPPEGKTLSPEQRRDSVNSSWHEPEVEPGTCSSPEPDAFQVLRDAASSSTQQRQRQARKLRLSRSSSASSSYSTRPRPKQQASLLDSGFCRFRGESPLSSEDSRDAFKAALPGCHSQEPDSTTANVPSVYALVSPTKNPNNPALVASFSFKVKVENELLLVPIERKKLQDINMCWLAEEAARRYYNLAGLRPVLRLKTADGFAYEDSDAVSVAIEQNMILASVVDWKISPLAQRYEEMCQHLKKDVQLEVQRSLETAQTSNTVQLNCLWLTPPLTEPIFRAIMHQSNLRVLDLANNFLQNEGCRQLAKSLSTLKQLRTLNLSGNFISADGLASVLNGAGSDKMLELEELILSQNPLGNASMRILGSFCSRLVGKALHRLALSHCKLSELYDYDLCYYQLTSFDISYNSLTDASVQQLLHKLNSCRLQYLDLSYCMRSANTMLGEHIAAFFESGTCQKFKRVTLAGCCLQDAKVNQIVQCLSKANELETIDVTDNAQLGSASLHSMLESLPHLRQIYALNCTRLVDAESVQRLEQPNYLPQLLSLTLNDSNDYGDRLQLAWQAHWGNKACMRSCPAVKHLLLYVNEKDVLDVVEKLV